MELLFTVTIPSLRTITGHAGLAGNTSGDDNDLRALQGLGELGGSGIVAADLVHKLAACPRKLSESASYLALGVDVADISGNTCIGSLAEGPKLQGQLGRPTGSQADVVEGELADARVQLQQQGERLADTTGSTENCDLRRLHSDISTRALPYIAIDLVMRHCALTGQWRSSCTMELPYLAGGGREAAALGLSEYLPGGEHCDGMGVRRDEWTRDCRRMGELGRLRDLHPSNEAKLTSRDSWPWQLFGTSSD